MTALILATAARTIPDTAVFVAGALMILAGGVGVIAWSKTFDVTRALTDLGPPSVSLADGVEAFVRWQRAQPADR